MVGGKPSAKLVVYGPARLAEKEMLDSLVAKQRDKVYEHTTVGRVFLALCHTDLDFDPSELSHPERCLADRKAVEWAASHSQISCHGKFLKDIVKSMSRACPNSLDYKYVKALFHRAATNAYADVPKKEEEEDDILEVGSVEKGAKRKKNASEAVEGEEDGVQDGKRAKLEEQEKMSCSQNVSERVGPSDGRQDEGNERDKDNNANEEEGNSDVIGSDTDVCNSEKDPGSKRSEEKDRQSRAFQLNPNLLSVL